MLKQILEIKDKSERRRNTIGDVFFKRKEKRKRKFSRHVILREIKNPNNKKIDFYSLIKTAMKKPAKIY